jgi:hypothetical protein
MFLSSTRQGTFLFVTQWAKTGSKHPEARGDEMNWWRAHIVGTVQEKVHPRNIRSGAHHLVHAFHSHNRKYAGEISFYRVTGSRLSGSPRINQRFNAVEPWAALRNAPIPEILILRLLRSRGRLYQRHHRS